MAAVTFKQFVLELNAKIRNAIVPYTIKTSRNQQSVISYNLTKPDILKMIFDIESFIDTMLRQLSDTQDVELSDVHRNYNVMTLKLRYLSLKLATLDGKTTLNTNAKVSNAPTAPNAPKPSILGLPQSVLYKLFQTTKGEVSKNLALTCRVMNDIAHSTISKQSTDIVLPHLALFIYHLASGLKNEYTSSRWLVLELVAIVGERHVKTSVMTDRLTDWNIFNNEGDNDNDFNNYNTNNNSTNGSSSHNDDGSEDNITQATQAIETLDYAKYAQDFRGLRVSIDNLPEKKFGFFVDGGSAPAEQRITHADVYASRFPDIQWYVSTGVINVELGIAFAAAEYILSNNALSPISVWKAETQSNRFVWDEIEDYAWIFLQDKRIDKLVSIWKSIRAIASSTTYNKIDVLNELDACLRILPPHIVNSTSGDVMNEVARQISSTRKKINKVNQWPAVESAMGDLFKEMTLMVQEYRYKLLVD